MAPTGMWRFLSMDLPAHAVHVDRSAPGARGVELHAQSLNRHRAGRDGDGDCDPCAHGGAHEVITGEYAAFDHQVRLDPVERRSSRNVHVEDDAAAGRTIERQPSGVRRYLY